jgi:hypothetical protein
VDAVTRSPPIKKTHNHLSRCSHKELQTAVRPAAQRLGSTTRTEPRRNRDVNAKAELTRQPALAPVFSCCPHRAEKHGGGSLERI